VLLQAGCPSPSQYLQRVCRAHALHRKLLRAIMQAFEVHDALIHPKCQQKLNREGALSSLNCQMPFKHSHRGSGLGWWERVCREEAGWDR